MAAVAGYLGQPCLSFGTSAQKLDHFEGLRKAEVGRTRAPVLLRCSFAIALGISLGKRAARPHCFESSLRLLAMVSRETNLESKVCRTNKGFTGRV